MLNRPLSEKLVKNVIGAPCLCGRERQSPLRVCSQRHGTWLVSEVVVCFGPCMLEQRLHLEFEEFRY